MSELLVPLDPAKKQNTIQNWLKVSSTKSDSSRKQYENPKKKFKKSNAKSLVQYINLRYSEKNPNVAVQVGLSFYECLHNIIKKIIKNIRF